MIKLILTALLTLTLNSLIAQNNQLDSLKKSLVSLKNDTTKVNHLNNMTDLLSRSDPEESRSYGKEAIALAKKINFMKGLAFAYENVAEAYWPDDLIQSQNYLEEALKTFRLIENKQKEADILWRLGVMYFYWVGLDSMAEISFTKSLNVAVGINDTVRQIKAAQALGDVLQKDNPQHALGYYLKADSLSNTATSLIRSSSRIVSVYTTLGKYDLAIKYVDIILANIKNYERVDRAYYYQQVGVVLYKLGKLDQSAEIFEQGIVLAKSDDMEHLAVDILLTLAKLQYDQGNYKESLKNSKEAKIITSKLDFRNINYYQRLNDANSLLSDNYKKLGDYQKALISSEEVITFTDSLMSINEETAELGNKLNWQLAEKEHLLQQVILEGEVNQAKQFRNFSFAAGGLLLLIAIGIGFQYMFVKKTNKIISDEKNRSEDLLLNILPEDTAIELKNKGYVNTRKYDLSTVLFTDFRDFTTLSENITADKLVKSLDYYFKEFDKIITQHDLEKIKTIGDSYMCVGGIPLPNKKNPIDVVDAAVDILKFVIAPVPEGIEKFDIRIGVNTGPIIAGIVGIKKFQYDVWGNTVNVASVMESNSEPNRINLSESTYIHIKDKYNCMDRGEIEVKHGKMVRMYFVEV